MTQKDLAEKLYVSDKAVSKWERGHSLPDYYDSNTISLYSHGASFRACGNSVSFSDCFLAFAGTYNR